MTLFTFENQFVPSDYNLFQRLRMFGEKPTLLILQCFKMFHYLAQSNATEDQTKLKQQIWTKHLRDVYVTFIHHLLCLLGLVAPTTWTDRSFELNLLLLVFTQAFHKISIKTCINNTENMPQVTLSNNPAISIDNEASDFRLLANFVLFLFKKHECYVSSNFGQMTNKRHVRCTIYRFSQG